MQKLLFLMLATTLMVSFSASTVAQEAATLAIKKQTGHKNAIDRNVGIPEPNISGHGKDFSVISFYPQVVPLKAMGPNPLYATGEGGSSAVVTIIFEIHNPSPSSVVAAVQYLDPISNNYVVVMNDSQPKYGFNFKDSDHFLCGDFNKQANKRVSCRLHLINLPNELTSITIYMYSLVGSGGIANSPSVTVTPELSEIKFGLGRYPLTEIKFNVPTVPRKFTPRQISSNDPISKGIKAQNGRNIATNNAGRNQVGGARLSDNPMLNQQSIPSSRTEGMPKNNGGNPAAIIFQRDKQAINPPSISPDHVYVAPNKNPGDPSPIMRNDGAIIFQQGSKSASVASGAGMQRPPSIPIANKAISASMEIGVNRYGGDYTSRDLATAEQCRTACDGEAQCKSWSWVKPGVQGLQAKCWLKNTVPAVSKNECCVSGVK